MLQSIRNGPQGHRRYREEDLLRNIQGNPLKNRPSDSEKETLFRPPDDEIFEQIGPDPEDLFDDDDDYCDSDQPHQKTSPDDRFTSWDKDTARARADVEIERLQQEKEKLRAERERIKIRAAEAAEKAQRRQAEKEWLRHIRTIGVMETSKYHQVPGFSTFLYPPASLIADVTKRMNDIITSSTCPMEEGDQQPIALWNGYIFAKRCANELIDEWLETERAKLEAKESKEEERDRARNQRFMDGHSEEWNMDDYPDDDEEEEEEDGDDGDEWDDENSEDEEWEYDDEQ